MTPHPLASPHAALPGSAPSVSPSHFSPHPCPQPRTATRWATWAAPALALALVGCAAPQIQDYAQDQPRLDLRSYFNGPVQAHGVFSDRFGRVIKRFTVQMQGQWSGSEGVLDEYFEYLQADVAANPGSRTQRRIWKLRDLGVQDGVQRYEGQADDVVGVALGTAMGNTLRWSYTLRLPIEGREWEVQFDDWMYLVDECVMLNRARMSKWGITLGEVTLSFQKAQCVPSPSRPPVGPSVGHSATPSQAAAAMPAPSAGAANPSRQP